jgi:hypothetical protein
MAVYKIFPSKDASIYSYYPNLNAGIDEILDLSLYLSSGGTNEVSRVVIQFPTDQINNIINYTSGSSFDVYMKLYLAWASEIPLDYTIYTYPVSESWYMGTGRVSNIPQIQDGVCWENNTSTTSWNILNISSSGVTSSYQSGSNIGGGNWYYELPNSSSLQSSQSFSYNTIKDIDINVTNIVSAIYSGSIINSGFILKHSSSLEFSSSSYFELKYFSVDTHTIFPPCLEFRWDDSNYLTGSNNVINQDNIVITIQNNSGIYKEDSLQRFRLGVRPQYPTRMFQTSSIYTTNYILPSSSYWSIKDFKTENTIIDFDYNYTKISADDLSSYFDVYMNGLQPERYYRLVVKTIMNNGSIQIFDNDYIFKLIR